MTTTVTDKNGNIVEQFIYDPWGKQEHVFSQSDFSTYVSPASSKGYTGHEGIQDFDLIHMNGRIYDPTLARFLQADPHIQFPTATQGYNRYSYVLNNPMNYTDPSGYFLSGVKHFLKKNWRTIAAIVLAYITYGLYTGAWRFGEMAGVGLADATIGGALAGAVSGAVATGTLKGAVYGGISGAAFGAIGGAHLGFSTTVTASGLTGGIMSVAQGGKFGNGFASAGASTLVSPMMPAEGNARVIAAAIVGGTISEVTGGKFGNGATTAAFAVIVSSAAQKISSNEVSVKEGGRTTVELRHKNIPGGDSLGNTNPNAYPQHSYVIVRDNVTGEEWIARAGPGGEGGNTVFGSIKGKTVRNVPGSTGDYGAQVNHSITVLTTDIAPRVIVDQLSSFTNAVNKARISYNPLVRNSNSFAYQAVEVLTGVRPPTQAWAPGAQTVLKVDWK